MFRIYRSSAGSGKTYTLALDYLILALKQPLYFRSILAVTFTNKATQEMKSRIVELLHKLAHQTDPGLEGNIVKQIGWTPEQIQLRAKECLSEILHNYSALSVKTIDSFFQQVLRSFTRELGLQGDFELELNTAKVVDAAIDMLMQDIGQDQGLTDWLVEFVKLRIEEGKSYNTREAIQGLAYEIHKEEVQPYLILLEKLAGQLEVLQEYKRRLYTQNDEILAQVKAFGQEAMRRIEEAGLTVQDFYYGLSGVANQFKKWSNGEFTDLSTLSRFMGALRDGAWYSKSSSKKGEIDQLVESFLHDHAATMLEYSNENLEYFRTVQVLLEYFYQYGIMMKLIAKIKQYKQEQDVLLLADTPPLIREIVGENDTPYIYEKVGTRFQHYLIDEFQDTSGLQWENFKPLVRESIASNNAGLVVGDVKQSIYRWRGGDWKLLLDQIESDLRPYEPKSVVLDTNWRSKERVIEFNNFLYEHLPSYLAQLIADKAGEEQAQKIVAAYQEAKQKSSSKAINNPEKGLVEMKFFDQEVTLENAEEEEEENVKWRDLIPEEVVKLLERLQDAGYSLRDSAILVRTNKDGNQLIRYLQDYQSGLPENSPYKFDVVSKEALAIGDAEVVQVLVNALRLITKKDHYLALTALCHAYWKIQNPGEIWSPDSIEAMKVALPEEFWNRREELKRLSLFELCEELILIFDLRVRGQIPYLQAFEDAILVFQQTKVADINTFLEWWEEEGSGRSIMISDEQDAIRVMTIHKSKGLQFPVVIMPYTDWKIDHGSSFTSPFLWVNEEPKGLLKVKLQDGEEVDLPVPIKYAKKLVNTSFKEVYEKECMQAALDALNMLYVATTRAEDALYLFAPKQGVTPSGKLKAIENVGEMLHGLWAVNQLNGLNAAEGDVLRIGELPQRVGANTGAMNNANAAQLAEFPIHPWQSKLQIKTRHKRLDYARYAKREERRKYGLLLHDLMAGIRSESDAEGVMQSFLFEGRITEQEKLELEQSWQTMLSNPEIKRWFNTDMEVRNESQILTPGGEIYRPDRVMLKEEKAVVLDFKTGAPRDADREQLAEYMQLLKSMGYADIIGSIIYTESAELLEVTI